MSVLSKILKIGLPIGAAVAAPFTGGASLLGTLGGGLKAAGSIPGALGAGGAAIGAASKSAAENRDAKLSGQLDLAKLLMENEQAKAGIGRDQAQLNLGADNNYVANQIARQQSGDASAQNAWKRLLSAQHTLSPNLAPNVSKYDAPARMPTDAEKQGANALTAEVMGRLQGGNPIAPVTRTDVTLPPWTYDPSKSVDPSLLNPGTGEKVGGWLSPILGYLGQGPLGSNQNMGIRKPMPTGTGPVLTATDIAYLRKMNPQVVR